MLFLSLSSAEECLRAIQELRHHTAHIALLKVVKWCSVKAVSEKTSSALFSMADCRAAKHMVQTPMNAMWYHTCLMLREVSTTPQSDMLLCATSPFLSICVETPSCVQTNNALYPKKSCVCLGVLLQLLLRRQNKSQEVQFEGLSAARMLHNSLYPSFLQCFTIHCLDPCHINVN